MKNYLYLFITLIILYGCSEKQKKFSDFQEIKDKGELTIITLSSSTSYFIYKDEPMGYDYDLIKSFCDQNNLNLNVKVAENSTRLIEMLENGEGDLIVSPIAIQNNLKDSIIYCGLVQESHQVLVQVAEEKDSMVTDVTQLIGKEVYVKHNTKYHQRMQNLDTELGNGIIIKDIEKDTITDEDLIEMVSLGEIEYTVADEYIAKLNKTYYHNIDISLALSFEQRSSWAVRKDTPLLAKALDEWFAENSKNPNYKSTAKKYFELSKLAFNESDMEAMTTLVGDIIDLPKGAISPFDNIFKKYAKMAGYDWQLLAAIAFQESRFQTNTASWAGAVGLMGLMPNTAKSFGITSDELKNPDVNVRTSVGLIRRLDKIFEKVADPEQKIKFVLAAYNGGNGHIADAQALAKKYGDDPYKWDGSVEKYVELKSNPKYYNDSVCKNGYLRSKDVINYVNQVSTNWRKFKFQM